MKTLKAYRLSLFMLVSTLSMGALGAHEQENNKFCCEQECEQDWCSGWKFCGQALFWKPCFSDSHYAIVRNQLTVDGQINTYHYIDPNWEVGGRVMLKKENAWKCADVMLSYTYFKADQDERVETSAGLSGFSRNLPYDPVLDSAAVTDVSTDWEFEHHIVELAISYDLNDPCCPSSFNYWAYTGLRILIFEEDRSDREVATTNLTFNREIDYWGFGSMLGVGFSYKICDCVIVFGTADVSFLLGQAEWADRAIETGQNYRFNAEDECYALYGWHLSKGIAYELCLCDYSFMLKAGWEMWQWYNAPGYLSYEHLDSGVISSGTKRNIAFSGAFLGLCVTY